MHQQHSTFLFCFKALFWCTLQLAYSESVTAWLLCWRSSRLANQHQLRLMLWQGTLSDVSANHVTHVDWCGQWGTACTLHHAVGGNWQLCELMTTGAVHLLVA
jgi:hypothetical protein